MPLIHHETTKTQTPIIDRVVLVADSTDGDGDGSAGEFKIISLTGFRSCTSLLSYRSVSKQTTRLDNLPRREVEFENPLLEGFEGLEVLALSHTDLSDLFSVLLDAVNFPHMAKILPVGTHLRQFPGEKPLELELACCLWVTFGCEAVIGFVLTLDLTGGRFPSLSDWLTKHSPVHICLQTYSLQQLKQQRTCLPYCTQKKLRQYTNITAKQTYFLAEKEAIFLILTGIGDEIYSTVDACNTSKEMWTAIERLQQGESLNVQDVKTNLFWEFGKFTSRDGESMESYYSRFYKLMNELTRNNLQVSPMQVNVQFLQQLQPEWSRFVTVVKQRQEIDTVSYHKLFDVLKQFQNEVNDIRSERLARSANPLALLAAAQPDSDNYYQAPKPQRSYAPSYKQSSSTRSSATTRQKGKEIAKPVTPQSESVSDEDSDPEQAQRDKDMQKNLALLAKYFKKLYKPTNNNLRTSSNSRNKTEDTTPRKTLKSDSGKKTGYSALTARDLDTMPGNAGSQSGLKTTCESQELEAHYRYQAKIQDVSPSESSSTMIRPLETVQNHDENENKTILKQLKKANASLTQELKECKTNLDETSRALSEATSSRDSSLIALQTKQTELEKYTALNDLTSDYKILQTKLN
ncbi:hypothetical protein Tco_0977259 [Tanacetum coccineum]|uniref:Gag-Pol polyprotein n=1 Tax=Tanacetum coccineum TaxID=301880 RepID=A0ABQ5EKP8_9ASTR